MGTLSSKKFLKHNGQGGTTEEATLRTTAGAADADRIPALNANGVLDKSIVNGKSGSTGAGDVDTVVTRDSAGRIALSDMPTGIGADVVNLEATESIAAGNYVNTYAVGGVCKIRNADAASGKEAVGFIKVAVNATQFADVYYEGNNDQVTGMTPGSRVFLSATTPGKGTATPPTGAGVLCQKIGFATSAGNVNFQYNEPITLAA